MRAVIGLDRLGFCAPGQNDNFLLTAGSSGCAEMVLLGSNGRRDSKVQRKEEGDNRDNIKQRHRTYTTTQHKLYTTKTYIGVASAKH